jgi:hypothetical protein
MSQKKKKPEQKNEWKEKRMERKQWNESYENKKAEPKRTDDV